MENVHDFALFDCPPLNEVVLGVQFAPAKLYSQIQAANIWHLFKREFPLVEEQPPLPPTFEMFGSPNFGQMNFNFVTSAQHNRFWFTTHSKDELIQFQSDRLLHNWKKVGEEPISYPRFNSIVEKFDGELNLLEKYFRGLAPQNLAINQAEISYVNHIPFDQVGVSNHTSDWLKIINFGATEPEDFTLSFRRTIFDANNVASGRLTCEITPVYNLAMQKMLQLTITARGKPAATGIASAILFLKQGHELAIKLFLEITTDSVQKKWGRVS